MDNLASDYIRTAIAKGVSFKQAVIKHAMRNSLIPIATTFGQNIVLIVSGSFLIESIFDIDGFGLLGLSAVLDRDYPGIAYPVKINIDETLSITVLCFIALTIASGIQIR